MRKSLRSDKSVQPSKKPLALDEKNNSEILRFLGTHYATVKCQVFVTRVQARTYEWQSRNNAHVLKRGLYYRQTKRWPNGVNMGVYESVTSIRLRLLRTAAASSSISNIYFYERTGTLRLLGEFFDAQLDGCMGMGAFRSYTLQLCSVWCYVHHTHCKRSHQVMKTTVASFVDVTHVGNV